MEKNHPVNQVLAGTMEKIKETIDANTVVGEPIVAGEVTLIPVSKISLGFGSGGSELPGKSAPKPVGENPFGGGGGAGLKVTPVCFLVVNGENVKVLPVEPTPESSVERLVDLIPDVMSRVSHVMEQHKSKKEGPAPTGDFQK